MKGLRLIFDGNNTAFRANAVTEMYTKAGERTSAIVGTLNIIHSVVEQLESKYQLPTKEIIFAWDKGHSDRRKALFKEYKANRAVKEKTEEEIQWMKEFICQANILYENLPLFGVKCVRQDGWEGDDLIYGVTKQLKALYPEDRSVIVSTDEDFHQLIDDTIDIYSPIKQVIFSKANYKDAMGIDQDKFLTYKLLKGDSSDGIPGIQGIGDKTAKILVNQYGSIEQLLSPAVQVDLMKSKRTAKIYTAEGLAILNRNNQLINLKDFVDLSTVKDYIEQTLTEEPTLYANAAKNLLMKYQILSILVKWNTWIQLFGDVVENWKE